MGRIVVAAAASHSPGILMFKDRADPEQAQRFYDAMERVSREVQAARPDALVVVTNEHFVNFYLNNVPAMCVGLATSYRGPVEPFMGEEQQVPGDRELGRALLGGLLAREFDMAFSEDLWFDHGTMVPLHFVNPEMALPVVPIMVNNLYEPMPTPRRLHRLGQAIAEVVDGLPEQRRIALLATGGLSHCVGTPDAGEITVEFDEPFLEGVRRGEGAKLAGLSHRELAEVGNGTHEVRNWLCAMGAMGDVPAEFVAYEPIAAWATGCGAAVWKPELIPA